MFFSGVFDEAISGRSTLEDHWSRRGHFLSMSAMEQSEAMTTWPHGNLRLPSQCHLKPQKIRLIKGLLRDNDWPYFLGGLALGGVPLDSHYDHGIFFLWFNKWLLLGGLGSGVGGLDSWNFVVKGIATLRVTLLGTTVTYPIQYQPALLSWLMLIFPQLRYVTVSFSGYRSTVHQTGGHDPLAGELFWWPWLGLLVMACRGGSFQDLTTMVIVCNRKSSIPGVY